MFVLSTLPDGAELLYAGIPRISIHKQLKCNGLSVMWRVRNDVCIAVLNSASDRVTTGLEPGGSSGTFVRALRN